MRAGLIDFNSIKVRLERSSIVGFHNIKNNFNSIKVRLEQVHRKIQNLQKLNFNSIKVRLEPHKVHDYNTPHEFQFHKGTIRTYC